MLDLRKITGVVMALAIFLCVTMVVISSYASEVEVEQPPYTMVKIHNPTFWSVRALVKCDWDGKKWSHIKKYNIRSGSDTIVIMPHSVYCEIWPSLR